LNKYLEDGVKELSLDNLPRLLNLKYGSIIDAEEKLNGAEHIKEIYMKLQKDLYE
jgi:type I restriction enzyme R subunit